MSTATRIDVYQVVTDRIIELLEQGTIPWSKPWKSAGRPMNLLSKRPYKGINVWLLSAMGYDQNLFLTFEQLKQLGGSVLKGEHGHVVVFWKTIKKGDDLEQTNGAKEKTHSILKYYKVFNVAQCKDIPQDMIPTIDVSEFDPFPDCEAIVQGMPSCPKIEHKASQAFYDSLKDYINMPKKKTFRSVEGYYAVLFHELIHSTGHSSRLNRKTITEMSEFGSEPYSKEELIAEIGSSYLSNFSGILDGTIKNNAAYIEGWLGKLKQDKRFIVFASAQAQRAADYILNINDTDAKGEVEQSEMLSNE